MASPPMILSTEDLDRIRSTVNTVSSANTNLLSVSGQQARTMSRSEELHLKSQQRAKSWSNTLEGSRRKKAEEKRKKLEMEEVERQKVDAEEAQIQLEARKATIDRANKLLYDESDRMKSFHSKMMLSDVLAERDAQHALKSELKKLEHIREDRFLEMEKQNYRKMLERELKEKETKEELARLAAKSQKEQLHTYKEKKYKEIEEEMLQGELLRRKGKEDEGAEKGIEAKRREQAVQQVQEMQKVNEYLKGLKAGETLREEREEQKIHEYAGRKEKMLELRKMKEKEVFEQKQAKRNHMIEEQAKRLAAVKDTEAQRIERQVQEKEDAERKRFEEQEALRKRWLSDINQSRAVQMQRKQAQREKERWEDAETARFLGEWCKVLDRQETEEVFTRRAAAKNLSEEHQKAVEIQRRRKEEDKRLDVGVAAQAKKAIEADTAEFHAHAEDIIKQYAAEGKNVIPLIKELRSYRKRAND